MSFELPPTWAASCVDYIGWENVVKDYFDSVTDSSGDARLALDEKPYTLWQPDGADEDAEFEVLLTEDREVDYFALYNFKLDGGTLIVETNPLSVGGSWTQLGTTIADDSDGAPYFERDDTRTARRIRLRFVDQGAAAYVAVFMVGQWMAVPRQDQGWTPPQLAERTVRSANVSNSGTYLGTSIYRAASAFDIKGTFLKLDWAYDVWRQFRNHARNRPFFYQWQIAEGGDTLFCWVEDEIPPAEFVTGTAVDAVVPVRGVTE